MAEGALQPVYKVDSHTLLVMYSVFYYFLHSHCGVLVDPSNPGDVSYHYGEDSQFPEIWDFVFN